MLVNARFTLVNVIFLLLNNIYQHLSQADCHLSKITLYLIYTCKQYIKYQGGTGGPHDSEIHLKEMAVGHMDNNFITVGQVDHRFQKGT